MPEEVDNNPLGRYVLTKEYIMKECVRLGYYRTPSCNEKLYLHHKGFDGVDPDAFKEYTDVKVLWLEGNCFSKLSCGRFSQPRPRVPKLKEDGEQEDVVADDKDKEEENVGPVVDIFESMYPTLRQIFLHGNMFAVMPDLSGFRKLDCINLTDNFIEKIASYCPEWEAAMTKWREDEEGASQGAPTKDCSDPTDTPSPSGTSKSQLLAPRTAAMDEEKKKHQAEVARKVKAWNLFCTHVTDESTCLCSTVSTLHLKNNHITTMDDIAALLTFKKLSVLDLSNNRLEDGEAVLQVLEKMPNLRSLYLTGNPCVRSITNYRKTVVSRCKLLMHLDDRPVFDDERRLVTAWTESGADGEKKERLKMRQEEEDRHRRRLDEFREMMAKGRAEAAQAQAAARDPLDTSTEEDTDSNPTPSTSEDEGDAAKTKKVAAPRVLSSSGKSKASTNEPARPHSEFFELNYGSKKEHDEEEETLPPKHPNDGSDGSIAFGTFRISSKGTTGCKDQVVSPPRRERHADPMAMEQVSCVLPEDDREVTPVAGSCDDDAAPVAATEEATVDTLQTTAEDAPGQAVRVEEEAPIATQQPSVDQEPPAVNAEDVNKLPIPSPSRVLPRDRKSGVIYNVHEDSDDDDDVWIPQ